MRRRKNEKKLRQSLSCGLPTSPSIMDDGDAGSQSLILAVSWDSAAPYYISTIQLEIPPQVHNASSSPIETKISTEFSTHIARILPRLQRPISWAISLPPGSSTEELYMLPRCCFTQFETERVGKLPGFTFNWRTKKCKIIKASLGPKFFGHAVTMGDHIYYMAQPFVGDNSPDPRFERYDTLSQSWEEREPFPLCRDLEPFIQGIAVLDDTILIILGDHKMWAYNAGRDKWYLVKASNKLCCDIVGVAVIVNKIIYAVAKSCELVMAMTLESRENKGDLVFTCTLRKKYVVPGIEQVEFDLGDSKERTKHLVHLGKNNFCVVRGYHQGFGVVENQYIQVTYIKISVKESIVTKICLHELKLPLMAQFTISHCFIMPTCKTTTALKEGNGLVKLNPEHEAEIVTLPPELIQISQSVDGGDKIPQVQDYVPKKISASVAAGNSNVPTKAGDGHSVFVTNLPPDALKVHNRLKRFGPIKNFHFRSGQNNTSESFADVEFECATSKQNAIKASTIKIGDRLAVIGEKRGTGLTQGGSVTQTSQSRDDVDTTPQAQEDDVAKKSSASVVAGKSNVPSNTSTLTGPQSLNYASKAGDGHSVFVTNLPPDALKVYNGLMRFGPIKNFSFHIDQNNTSKCFADVEFEIATSKQTAIKASTIKFGDRLAAIEEKRGTGLTQGGSVSQTSRGDDVYTTPQFQEDVPKKSSTSVVADKSNLPSKVSTVTGSQSLNYAMKASTLGDGHSICITNLPPDIKSRKIFMRLKRFGPIKSVRIHTYTDNNMVSECSADVEFENATSKQEAIKESIITIGSRIAAIEEKRGPAWVNLKQVTPAVPRPVGIN